MFGKEIGVVIDEGKTGLSAKITKGGITKMEIPFSPSTTPEEISDGLSTFGTQLKYERGLTRTGEMLINAAKKVPDLATSSDNSESLNSDVKIQWSPSPGRYISKVGVVTADAYYNTENLPGDDDDNVIPEIVR